MIGLIQRVLINLVRDQGGDIAVQAGCFQAGVPAERKFRIDTDYDDVECLSLIEAAAMHFGLDEKMLYRLYADQFIRESRVLFPMFYQMSTSARDFLKRQPWVHDILASSLRSAKSRDRVRDKFSVEEIGDTLEVTSCQKRGDPVCTFCLRTETAGE